MARPHAAPGTIIDVSPLGPALEHQQSHTLIKTDALEVIRLVLPKGKEIANHKAPGPITVQCLEGQVAFTTLGKVHEMGPGSLLYLNTGEEHALLALEHASILLTILLSKD